VVTVAGLLWWLLLGSWLAVRLTNPGPGLFAQERVGRKGRVFRCYKFRTMQVGTRNVGTHDVDATQITPVGRFLRKTKVDEFPQAWNLLKGEMSVVGPRPCLPVQTDLIEARRSRGVLEVPGGITGWAQIKNVDMSDPEKLAKLDAEYVALRTILLDLKILVATATGHGQGDKTP
jgi:lipopolysaccharide/colanic/teichoic acid biosynthesis glycosyltransferase